MNARSANITVDLAFSLVLSDGSGVNDQALIFGITDVVFGSRRVLFRTGVMPESEIRDSYRSFGR